VQNDAVIFKDYKYFQMHVTGWFQGCSECMLLVGSRVQWMHVTGWF